MWFQNYLRNCDLFLCGRVSNIYNCFLSCFQYTLFYQPELLVSLIFWLSHQNCIDGSPNCCFLVEHVAFTVVYNILFNIFGIICFGPLEALMGGNNLSSLKLPIL